MSELYDKALAFATEAHAGQVRKFTGEDFISHPVAVAAMVEGEDAKAVALLHDVLEDTKVTSEELYKEDFPTIVIKAVEDLTRSTWFRYEIYIENVSSMSIARPVKIADLKHNLSTLPTGHDLEVRYRTALKVLEGADELEVMK